MLLGFPDKSRAVRSVRGSRHVKRSYERTVHHLVKRVSAVPGIDVCVADCVQSGKCRASRFTSDRTRLTLTTYYRYLRLTIWRRRVDVLSPSLYNPVVYIRTLVSFGAL